jgi:hypothetical protein
VSEPTGGAPKDLPEDIATGFWLWVAALPLLVTGYVVDMVVVPAKAQSCTRSLGCSSSSSPRSS